MSSMTVEQATNATNAALTTPDWWANGVRAPYARGESMLSLIHGNTDDFVWLGWSLDRWVAQQFAGTQERPGQEVVVMYSPARGLTFQTSAQKKLFDRTMGWPPPLPPEVMNDPEMALANQPPEDMPLPPETDQALALALDFLRAAQRENIDDPQSPAAVSRRHPEPGVTLSGLDPCRCGVPSREHNIAYHDGARSGALIVNHLELLASASAPQPDDATKRILELLHDAGTDPGLIGAWNPIALVAREISGVHQYVRSAPGMKTIRVPLPDYAARLDTWYRLIQRESLSIEMSAAELAKITAGLGRRDLEDIALRAENGLLTAENAIERQTELMDTRYGGVLIRLDTNIDFEDLGGMVEVKKEIDERMIAPIKSGHPELAIKGLALCGPPGTGKSDLAVAAGKRAGINAIEIRASALKSKWHGESEQLTERFIEGAEMFAPTFVFIDEYDKVFGSSDSASQENAPDQNQRARMQQWMATAKNIYFMVATNYPNRVDPALFRSGRIDVKAPILAPETPAERADILGRILVRFHVDRAILSDAQLTTLCTEHTEGWVGSDLFLAVKDAIGTMTLNPKIALYDALADALANIIPADNPGIQQQTREAILACNNLRLLPPAARERRLRELRSAHKVAEQEEAPATPPSAVERRRREVNI
jgi:hypothetical protein